MIDNCCYPDDKGHPILDLKKVEEFGKQCKDILQQKYITAMLEDIVSGTPGTSDCLPKKIEGDSYVYGSLKRELENTGTPFEIHHLRPCRDRKPENAFKQPTQFGGIF